MSGFVVIDADCLSSFLKDIRQNVEELGRLDYYRFREDVLAQLLR